MPVIGRNPPPFTPPSPTASTQPRTVDLAAQRLSPYPPHPASFRIAGDGSFESTERNQRLQSALYCGWSSLKRVENYAGNHAHCYQADVSLSPGHTGTVMAIFEGDPQRHSLTTVTYAGSETGFVNETGDVLAEQASQPHPPHPGLFRLLGDDSPVNNECNQRLRSALQCGWYSLRRDEIRSNDHAHYYQAQVSLSPGQAGVVMAVFKKDAQGHQLTTVGYLGSETGFRNETDTVIPEQAPPSAQGEFTPYAHQPLPLPGRLSGAPSVGSSTLTGYSSAFEQTLVAPPSPPPSQLNQIPGIPLERKPSLEQLVQDTLLHAREKKLGKNSKAVKKIFTQGIATLNAKPGKPSIVEENADTFYATASAHKTRLPQELLAKFNANRERLAKKRFGPNATVNDYERANKTKLAQKLLGSNATGNDYSRAKRDTLAKDTLGADATTTDYERAKREQLAKNMFGDDATGKDYDHAKRAAQAIRELGPTGTVADLAKLQAEDRAVAARRGVDVKEIRRERRQKPASISESNQRSSST